MKRQQHKQVIQHTKQDYDSQKNNLIYYFNKYLKYKIKNNLIDKLSKETTEIN